MEESIDMFDFPFGRYKAQSKNRMEDKKDQEVRGGAVPGSGMYAFRYMSSGETSQRVLQRKAD